MLKTMKPGQGITLTDGRTVEFVEMKRTKFVGIMDGKRFRIPSEMFACEGKEASDKVLLNRAKEEQARQLEFNNKKAELKKLVVGDRIEVRGGEKVTFLKVNRKKFIGQKQNGLDYEFPIQMFEKLIEKNVPDPKLERIKKLAKKYKGHTIDTVWGPSRIGTLTHDHEFVTMYEHDLEEYHLRLPAFLEELETNGLAD